MKTSIKVIHWLPRVICILAILFISLFAADAFEPQLTIWQQIGGFFMHLIPSFILFVFLMVAWKWELAGGIIFTITGLGMSPFIFIHNYNINHSVGMSLGIIMAITFPFVIVGILFIISHFMKKRKVPHNFNFISAGIILPLILTGIVSCTILNNILLV